MIPSPGAMMGAFASRGRVLLFPPRADGCIRFNGHDKLGAEMTESLMLRLRFSRADIEATVAAVANHMVFKDVQQMRVSKLKRFMARPTFEAEMELHRVDCTSSHGALDNYDLLRTKRDEFASEPLIPKPLITGRDLLALGLPASPRFSEILEGTLTSAEEAVAWVKAYPLTPRRVSPF